MASDPTPDWLASVTRSFTDNPELHLAAQQELAEQATDADATQLAALGERFDNIDQASPRKRNLLRWLPIALVIIAVPVISIILARPYFDARGMTHSLATFMPEPHTQASALRSRLSPADHFAIFGDTTQPTEELAIKALWETDPDNAILFNYYLNHCETYPEDLLETAEQIDPDNGWFLLVAAGELAKDITDKEKRPWDGLREDRPVVHDWKITDPDEFQVALALIKKASAKPRIERYDEQHLSQRLSLLPEEQDLSTRLVRMVHTAATPTKGAFHALNCSNVISAHIWQLGLDKDTEAISEMIPVVEQLCNHLNSQDDFLVSQLVVQAVCRSNYEHLLEACERAGMTEKANRIRPIVAALRLARSSRYSNNDDQADLLPQHGSALTAMSAPPVTRFGVTPPTLDDLTPGRRADYALADRAALVTAGVALLFAILATLPLPYLRGRLPARIGIRFADLLRPSDWLWILALGTLLPLLWILVITRLTPLGCRDWSLVFFPFQPILTQYSIAIVLIIPSTLCAIRWRVGKNAGALGFAPRHPRWSLVPPLLIALAIPVPGLIRNTSAEWPITAAIIPASIVVIWLLILVCRSIFGRYHRSAYRSAIARVLPRAFSHSALLLLALIPLTIVAERKWIARDELGRTSPENLGMGRLEAQATRALRATIQDALDAKP